MFFSPSPFLFKILRGDKISVVCLGICDLFSEAGIETFQQRSTVKKVVHSPKPYHLNSVYALTGQGCLGLCKVGTGDRL